MYHTIIIQEKSFFYVLLKKKRKALISYEASEPHSNQSLWAKRMIDQLLET